MVADMSQLIWMIDFGQESWNVTIGNHSNPVFISRLSQLLEHVRQYFTLDLLDVEYLFWRILAYQVQPSIVEVNQLHLPWNFPNPRAPGRLHALREWDPEGDKTFVYPRAGSILRRTDRTLIFDYFSLTGNINHSSYKEFRQRAEASSVPVPESHGGRGS